MSTTQRAWAKALAEPGVEFDPVVLPVLSGSLPLGLQGTLYQNGPACLERGGKRVGHWFDGDGAILGVHFRPEADSIQATGLYRYVRSWQYLAEVEADRFLFSNYGMAPSGLLWQRWGQPAKNAANTSVLILSDRLLALWEGGHPHALDFESLATIGLDSLEWLTPDTTYSAHPKQDPHTGLIYNFGLQLGINAILQLYVSDRTGKVVRAQTFPLQGVPLIHDFVLAGPYLVFAIPPLRLSLIPVALGLSGLSDALQWQPDRGTQILVFDRETLKLVSRSETTPCYQWHFSNGYVNAQGMIVIDLVRYEDFQTNQRLKEVATGELHTQAIGELWRWIIDPQTAQLKEADRLSSQSCEFPVVAPQEVGQETTQTYLTVHPDGADLVQDIFGAIAAYDHKTQQLTVADLGENHYPFAPIYVRDCLNPEQHWLLTIVFDGNSNHSEIWIFRGDRLSEEPVCRLGLPQIIPFGFHGTFRSIQ
jgi:carotenoid cleavage dioxygenase-like enzyme